MPSLVIAAEPQAPGDSDTVITITAKPQPSSALTSPQSVSVMEGRELEQRRGQNAVDAIKDEPGVSLFTTGAGVAKPVIRGLTSQRVLIVSDGVRHEVQQWGDEHHAQIDPLNVDRVEVLRGPNSLLYGSDALGGVIAFSRPELPNASQGAPKLAGKAIFNAFSNNNQAAGGVSLFGAAGALGYRLNLSGRDTEDYRDGRGDRVPNSSASDANASGTVGVRQDWGEFAVDYDHVAQKVELPEEDPLETPHQRLTDNKIQFRTGVPVGAGKIEAIGAFQKSRRVEFETIDASEQALNLLTETKTFDLKAHHAPLGPVKGTVGAIYTGQDFETLGLEALIPSFTSRTFGAYVYEELTAGKLTLSAGVRGDTQKYDIESNDDIPVDAQTQKYNQMTGAVGAVWHAAAPLAFAVNVGRGWRAPVPFELFVNGEHEGTGRFELGDPNLKPEKSTNVDLATRYSTKRLKCEIAVFRNRIDDFIFAQDTGGIDVDSGLPVFQNTQADATLTGGELLIEGSVTDWLILSAGYDVVRGKNDQTDEDLPFIPADRFRGGIRVQGGTLARVLDRPYIGVGAKAYRRQDRVALNEAPTPGFTLWEVTAGSEIKVGDSHLNVDIGAENVTDKEYADHLSRNKAVGILNPGRNLFVKLSMPFGLVK